MKKIAVFALLLCVVFAVLVPSVLAMESNCLFRGIGYYAPYAVDEIIDVTDTLLPAPKTADGLSILSLSVLLVSSGAICLMLKKH